MSPFWRNLLITVVVALLAGGIGGWMGAQKVLDSDAQTLPLRQTVHEIVRQDLKLTPDQTREIQAIEDKYYNQRATLRQDVAMANRELADALMADMAFGREAQQASNHVERGLGELQRATILYVLELRDVLTPEQQMIYDRKVRDVLTATASPRP
ncbi:MAG TPA: periplasmic heavy metal sensor [Micropepsaceae bacterium]|nr:periplasmic heavy metal sensor [Micropepsaceae bacterium]